MAINLEKENKKDVRLETSNSPYAEIEEMELTSENLISTTRIHGWLFFFLARCFVGGLYSAIYPLSTFKIEDYGGSYILGMSDILFGILGFILAMSTIYSFYKRKPNAVFLGYSYSALCVVSHFIAMCCGVSNPGVMVASLIWGCIWIMYLRMSHQVEDVIPSDFRKTNKLDYCLVASVIVIPVLFLVAGAFDIQQKQTTVNEKCQELQQNFYDEVKDKLYPNQRTDGRVIFEIPQGFECNDTTIQGLKVFYMENKDHENITLCSEYANKTDLNDTKSRVNRDMFDIYRDKWEDVTLATCVESRIVSSTEEQLLNCKKRVKIKRYVYGQNIIYWRFVMLFDKDSDKICLISAYDQGYDSYLDDLIYSVQFHP